MRTVEFDTHYNPDRTLAVPPEVAALLADQQEVRVKLLIPEGSEDPEWEELTAAEFLKGYVNGDDIYDQLSNG